MSPILNQPIPNGCLLALAVYDFQSIDESQLSFVAGEYLFVNATDPLGEDDDEDWIFARHQATGDEGFVPSTFLKEVPRHEIEYERVSSEIRNLTRMMEIEQNIFNGFQEVLNSPSLKKGDRNLIQSKLQDSEGRLAELNDRLHQFQEFLSNLSQGEDMYEDEEDDDDEMYQKPPPIPPFVGELKSILRTPTSPKPPASRHVVFNLPNDALTPAQQYVMSDLASEALPPDSPQKSPRNSIHESKPTSLPPSRPKHTRTSSINIFKRKSKPTKLSAKIAVSDIQNPIMQGYLWTDSHSNLKSWSRRFFVLKDSVLYIYKKPSDAECCEMMILPSYAITPSFDTSKQWAFKASHPGMATRIFAADDKSEFTRWMNAMSLATIVEQTDVSQPAYRRKRESSQEGLALKSFSKIFDDEDRQAEAASIAAEANAS